MNFKINQAWFSISSLFSFDTLLSITTAIIIKISLIGHMFNFFKSLPIFSRFFKGGAKTGGDSSFFNQYFSKVMTQSNLGVPPMTESIAYQILNIEKKEEPTDPKLILQRYYTLFKKNDPKVGGTTYLQSKVYVAKETLMAEIPNAAEMEQTFFKEVIEPEEKAEAEAKVADDAAKKEQKDKEDKRQTARKEKESQDSKV